MKKLLSATLLALMLSGCGQKVQTIEYYKAHLDEATKVAKDCRTADKTNQDVLQNCKNAVAALTMNMFKNGATSAPAYGTYKINPSFSN